MRQVAYMYGFKKNEPETVGWLSVCKCGAGYAVVDDQEKALKLTYKNTSKTKGWAPPEKWLDFFNHDSELKDWKFHIVKITEN